VSESRLYLLCGLPFAGKTTLAQELVNRLGFMHIDIDQINTSLGVGLHASPISPVEWDRTYNEAYKRLEDALNSRQTVIFEGANYTKELRNRLRAIADRQDAITQVIFVEISMSEARQRLLDNRKTQQRHDVRDDNFALVATDFELPTKDERVIHYYQSHPLEEWISQNFKTTNH
jgi:predicted kinase